MSNITANDLNAEIINLLEQIYALADAGSTMDFSNLDEQIFFHYFSTMADLAMRTKLKVQMLIEI